MKRGPIISGLVAVVALGAAVMAFTTSASPYVTIQQAKSAPGDRLHVAGDIVPGSVRNDVFRQELTFRIKDAEGSTVQVVHRGEKPANMAEATQVVAVGKMTGDAFVSQQLIVKCPSKYEGENANAKERPQA
ncbi:MAG: cytochrome c maturation protein CcmE [Fimbriimonadaceae bacterium]|nr:cytochrome c maturation protein CcmE [Fimbriimonadaceae bacterium]